MSCWNDEICRHDFGRFNHHHHPHQFAWCHQWHQTCLIDSVTVNETDGLQIQLDVRHFKFDELTVKTLDNVIAVQGKKKDRDDDFVCITKQFTRKYKLPRGYDAKMVVSTLSSDGILHVKAPKPDKMPEIIEITVEIQQTGPFFGNKKEVTKPSLSQTDDNNVDDHLTNNNEEIPSRNAI